MNKITVLDHLRQTRIIAWLPAATEAGLIAALTATRKGGLGAAEVPMSCPAIPTWLEASQLADSPDLMIGVGTVIDTATARAAILAGAKFIATPALRPEVILLCRRFGVPVICGTHSLDEIRAALQAGADAVKVFPTRTDFGPTYVRAVRAEFPDALLIPVGGVTPESLPDFLAAGADAVLAGHSLGAPETGFRDAGDITRHAQAFAHALRQAAPA